MRPSPRFRFDRNFRRRRPMILGGSIAVAVIIAAAVMIRHILAPAPYRQAVFVAGKNPSIVSFSPAGPEITVLSIPKNLVIKAARGYGMYSIEALMTLDELDKQKGRLVTESVADAFGIPVIGMVRSTADRLKEAPREYLARTFSPDALIGSYRAAESASVPFVRLVAFALSVRRLPPNGLTVVAADPAIFSETLPDGSSADTLDEAKLDFILGTSFIDADIRSESVALALYNAANVPLVGTRTSRMLSRIGIQLVSVGNAPSPHQECRIWGSRKALLSVTGRFVRDYFSCVETQPGSVGAETGADLIVELGQQYAERFR